VRMVRRIVCIRAVRVIPICAHVRIVVGW